MLAVTKNKHSPKKKAVPLFFSFFFSLSLIAFCCCLSEYTKMAGSELPFPNNARAENATIFGGSRFGRKKRTIFVLLLVAVFFVLWFNSDLDRLSNTVVDSESAKSPKTTPTPPVVIEDDDSMADLDDQPEPVPVVEKEKAPVKAVEDKKKKPSTLAIIPETTPQHFKYLMIIASRASNLSRRQLIRKTYFNMEDNLEPCMKKDKGFNYMFWVYGDKPTSKTPERRLYETEKIEWNDLEKVDQSAYNQDEVLKWVKYFYLKLVFFMFYSNYRNI